VLRNSVDVVVHCLVECVVGYDDGVLVGFVCYYYEDVVY